jgi:hypothetical protein
VLARFAQNRSLATPCAFLDLATEALPLEGLNSLRMAAYRIWTPVSTWDKAGL